MKVADPLGIKSAEARKRLLEVSDTSDSSMIYTDALTCTKTMILAALAWGKLIAHPESAPRDKTHKEISAAINKEANTRAAADTGSVETTAGITQLCSLGSDYEIKFDFWERPLSSASVIQAHLTQHAVRQPAIGLLMSSEGTVYAVIGQLGRNFSIMRIECERISTFHTLNPCYDMPSCLEAHEKDATYRGLILVPRDPATVVAEAPEVVTVKVEDEEIPQVPAEPPAKKAKKAKTARKKSVPNSPPASPPRVKKQEKEEKEDEGEDAGDGDEEEFSLASMMGTRRTRRTSGRRTKESKKAK